MIDSLFDRRPRAQNCQHPVPRSCTLWDDRNNRVMVREWLKRGEPLWPFCFNPSHTFLSSTSHHKCNFDQWLQTLSLVFVLLNSLISHRESTDGFIQEHQGMQIKTNPKNLPLDSTGRRDWSHSLFGCFSDCGTCMFIQTAFVLGC